MQFRHLIQFKERSVNYGTENNLEVQKVNTAVSQWTNSITNLVTKDFELCGVPYDDYSKQCAMSAMTSIYQLVKDSDKIKDLNGLDTSNLREVVGQCASLKLNANAVPRECYFQLRTKKSGENYVQVVEWESRETATMHCFVTMGRM